MAKVDWAILCDYAFRDINRKMCMIGVFDRIFAPSVPATHHQSSLAIKLIGEATEKVRLRVEIVRPNNDTLAKFEGTGELAEMGTAEITMGMAGLPLPDFGIYAFNIYLNDALERSITITVARQQTETKAG